MRLALILGLLAIICLSVHAEDHGSHAEPEPGAEPESEPEHSHDEDSKHSGSTVSKGETKAATGKNPASAPWAFSIPTIITLSAVAKFVL